MPGSNGPGWKAGRPDGSALGARQKWLKPTSYSVADEAKLAMWPPRSPGLRFARTTIAIAFQRISERMRHSIVAIARRARFQMRRDGVDVFGGRLERQIAAGAARLVDHALEQVMRAIGAVGVDDAFQRVGPFPRFGGIEVLVEDVGQLVHASLSKRPGRSGRGAQPTW